MRLAISLFGAQLNNHGCSFVNPWLCSLKPWKNLAYVLNVFFLFLLLHVSVYFFPKPSGDYAVVFINSLLLFFFSSSPVDPTQFPRKEIPKRPKDPRPSTLALLLAEYNRRSANPFFGYSKFNGEVSYLSCWVMLFIVDAKVICIAPLAAAVLSCYTLQCSRYTVYIVLFLGMMSCASP